MNNEFLEALDELEKEKHISKEVLIEAIESALLSAYKKNYGTAQNVRVAFNRDTGEVSVLASMEIVEEVEEPMLQISLVDAKAIDPRYEIGDAIEFQVMPKDFGRIAALTAKQVVVQRIREAERKMVYDEFNTRVGEIVTGIVQRKNHGTMFVDIGRTEGILPLNEQVKGEDFEVNERLKVYIMDVKDSTKGPQVFLSRTHPGIVKGMFKLEVPEIQDGTVEIKSISREAGSRTKLAVYTEFENVDAVGACVGTRGARVQNVVDELGGEKIDIIPWSEDAHVFISNVLSPAKVEQVFLDEEEHVATVVVPDYQLSLAIGKEGQNVRLAAKVSGWKIDIKSHTVFLEEEAKRAEEAELAEEAALEEITEEATEIAEEAVEITESAEEIVEEAAEEIEEIGENLEEE